MSCFMQISPKKIKTMDSCKLEVGISPSFCDYNTTKLQ